MTRRRARACVRREADEKDGIQEPDLTALAIHQHAAWSDSPVDQVPTVQLRECRAHKRCNGQCLREIEATLIQHRPEWTPREMLGIIKGLGGANIRAFDLVEVSPSWDNDGITSRLGVRIILDTLAAIARAKKQ